MDEKDETKLTSFDMKSTNCYRSLHFFFYLGTECRGSQRSSPDVGCPNIRIIPKTAIDSFDCNQRGGRLNSFYKWTVRARSRRGNRMNKTAIKARREVEIERRVTPVQEVRTGVRAECG